MNLKRINLQAKHELLKATAVDREVERVRQLGKGYPNGTDFRIDELLIEAVEARCDAELIPFHRITNNYASTARDYIRLAAYERQR